jgi:hypothetical protein
VLRCGGHPVNLAVPEAYDTALPVAFKVHTLVGWFVGWFARWLVCSV